MLGQPQTVLLELLPLLDVKAFESLGPEALWIGGHFVGHCCAVGTDARSLNAAGR